MSEPDRKVMAILLLRALTLASQGFRIVRLLPNSKLSAFARITEATTNPTTIREWWSKRDYNIGIATGRAEGSTGRWLVVIDYDCKPGQVGEETLKLHRLMGYTETMTVKTPNGVHCYYWSETCVKSTASKVAKHVDVRGYNGYVVAPGSIINGAVYELLTGPRTPAVLPADLLAAAVKPGVASATIHRLHTDARDRTQDRDRAREYLINEAPEAIEGSGGDAATYQVAARVIDFGITVTTCLELMLSWWNEEKAIPPWAPEDLEVKVQNAWKYRQNAPGVDSLEAFDEFIKPEPIEEKAEADEAEKPMGDGTEKEEKEEKKPEKPEQSLISATPFILRDPRLIPRRDFVYGRHYIRKFGSATIAPGAVGKSSLQLVEAVAMATGRDLLGVQPKRRVRVWYWNGEDPYEELERRIGAICLHYGVAAAELEGWLFVDSARRKGSRICLATETRSGTIINQPVVQALMTTVIANKIDVIMIDPFISSHQVTENDNNSIDMVVKAWTAIADLCNIALDLAHHSRKTGGAEVTVEDGRGAVALVNAVRSARVLNAMSEKEAVLAGVKIRSPFFKVSNGKPNLAPKSETADWYRLLSVKLGNGTAEEAFEDSDQIGVVTLWTPPMATEGVAAEDFAKIAAIIRGGRWREQPTAAMWVGKAVAQGLGLSAKADKGRIAALLAAWEQCGLLRNVPGLDDHRMTKMFTQVVEEEEFAAPQVLQ